MHEGRYNLLDKFLHHLALDFPSLAELSFDIEQKTIKKNLANMPNEKHVFIAGLARAGTTILMRRFYETGRYRSLTYRDMPFVLAPNLWHKISSASQQNNVAVERMHGDGIKVNYDSPEALEEVFWRIFTGNDYIKNDHLVNYQVHDEIINKYRQYVASIITSSNSGAKAYLSKNNNNILRLPSIRKAFPSAMILIPFREPLAHANSLLNQHKLFIQLQKQDKFTRSYMDWLVHHEFGTGHKAFVFDNRPIDHSSTLEINYWLDLWYTTYEALLKLAPDNSHFICYEDLCENPEIWHQISEKAGLIKEDKFKHNFKLSTHTVDVDFDAGKLQRASQLYNQLRRKF